jgi:peptidase M28-like protein
MRIPRFVRLVVALVLLVTATAVSQDAVDLTVIDRIKNEAFARSEVMDHLRNLTDVHGPRLTASPLFEEAAKWAVDRLTAFGLTNVHIDRWGPFGRSWAVDEYSVELVAPHYMRLTAMPLAWSASTPGAITGEPLLTPINLGFLAGFKQQSENFEAYKKQWSGKLRGRIVLFSPSTPTPPRDNPLFKRLSDAELAEMTQAPEPAAVSRVTSLDELEWPDKPEEVSKLFMAMPAALVDQLIDRYDALALERTRFFVAEGVAAILIADNRAREGLLAAEAAGPFRSRTLLTPIRYRSNRSTQNYRVTSIDNGSGKIRGVYLQEHEAMRPLFQQWLAPLRDLGVTTITIRNTGGGTDHLSFTRVGLPGFQFIQDPLDYGTLTHHTSADTFDHAVAADLMQASAVIASVVYHAANRGEQLPRRELPQATGASAKPNGAH